MASKFSLRDMLLLEVGGLDDDTANQLRRQITQSSNAQRVWELVRQTTTEVNQAQRNGERLIRSSSEYDAERIAAYLDGTIEGSLRSQLEREAIRSPRLLKELLLHFRQHFSAGAEPLIPWSTTEKLFRLGDGLVKEVAAKSNSNSAGVLIAPLPPSPSAAFPVSIQMARAVDVSQPSRKVIRSRPWALAAAVAVCVAGLLGAIWFTGGPDGFLEQSPVLEFAGGVENGKAESPAIATGELPNANGADRELSSKSARTDSLRSATSNGDWTLVTLEDSIESENFEDVGQVDPDASVFHQQSRILEDLTWLKLEGVVALREKGKETWFGPRSSARIINGLEWQTLPGSWVSARLGKLGEIVLDAGSSVVVSTLVEEQLIGLEMQAGRIGLKKLPAQTKLKVKYERTEWEIEVAANGTTLGLDWLNGTPRLSVYSGAVSANQHLISANRQIVWNAPGLLKGDSLTNMPKIEPVKDSLAWLGQPTKVNALSVSDQAELLASTNVVSSLNRMEASRPISERVLAQYLPAVLSPEVHLLGVLEGSEQKSREEALEWLIGLSPRSPKTRQLWRTIAEKSGTPDHTREFFRLIQLARNAVPTSESDARFLTSGLKHERLFVREMSQLLLEFGFGNTARYDAADDPGKRNLAADLWTREVLQSYRPAATPKR